MHHQFPSTCDNCGKLMTTKGDMSEAPVYVNDQLTLCWQCFTKSDALPPPRRWVSMTLELFTWLVIGSLICWAAFRFTGV